MCVHEKFVPKLNELATLEDPSTMVSRFHEQKR